MLATEKRLTAKERELTEKNEELARLAGEHDVPQSGAQGIGP